MTATAAAPSVQPRICIANINPGELRYGFVQSLLDTQRAAHAEGRPVDLVMKPSGPYLDTERNLVLQRALNETDAEVFLFIDSDIWFSWTQVEEIAEHCTPAQPVVSGLYFSPLRNGGINPVVFDWSADHTQLEPVDIDNIRDRPPVGAFGLLREVTAVGTGFMAIHRSLLLEMVERWGYPMPWFVENVIGDVWMGEDLCFCLRVAAMGYPVLVHTEIHLGHDKAMRFTIDNHLAALEHRRTQTREKVPA